jgi:dTDP-4-dehydrorhamnose reductase
LIAGEALWGTYHFAGDGVTTWHGFAERIIAAQALLTGRKPIVKAITTAEYPQAARRPQNAALECSLFTRTFGFSPKPWGADADAVTADVVNVA